MCVGWKVSYLLKFFPSHVPALSSEGMFAHWYQTDDMLECKVKILCPISTYSVLIGCFSFVVCNCLFIRLSDFHPLSVNVTLSHCHIMTAARLGVACCLTTWLLCSSFTQWSAPKRPRSPWFGSISFHFEDEYYCKLKQRFVSFLIC